MAAMLVVCDHLDSDTNELTFPRFGRKKYGVNDPRQIRFANVATSFVAGTQQFHFFYWGNGIQGHVTAVDVRVIIPSRKHLSTTLI